tara:strand:- start:135 stop:287 length:153 start_codon:yes stop_codon:yes gene_type:complete
MNENEMKENIATVLISQIEEKIKMTKWNQVMMDQLDQKLDNHFKSQTNLP